MNQQLNKYVSTNNAATGSYGLNLTFPLFRGWTLVVQLFQGWGPTLSKK